MLTSNAEMHEKALVKSFIVAAKRRRVLFLLQNIKRRRKNLKALDHFRDIFPTCICPIAPVRQTFAGIEKMLHSRGAPETCYVISTMPELDGRVLPLRETLEKIVGSGRGTILSCVPGTLAYFEGEGPSERFILEKTLKKPVPRT